jgi:hypothetical protein
LGKFLNEEGWLTGAVAEQMLSKAGILAKPVKPATAWREATEAETIGTSQRQQQKGDPQQQY